jgi:putative membrane protein
LAVLVAVVLLPGIHYRSTTDLFVASLLLGILNAFIRPILLLVALPLLILTLGLFMLVINACMLGLVHVLMGAHFEVDGFGWALLGAIIISVVSTALNLMTGGAKSRFSLRVQRRPPGNRPDGGNGPVIDV